MSESGRGVAVANANPKVLSVADEICPSNNEDGVAQWIEAQLVEPVETREHAKIELVLNRGYALNRCSKDKLNSRLEA